MTPEKFQPQIATQITADVSSAGTHLCPSATSAAKEENAPKVSVIVPVYKVEKYLTECIESVLAQTFPDFELLLVDDGSPDNSGAICDDYAARDPRIRVFHKENGGVAHARQVGLLLAKGEFVMFLDSDDTLEIDGGIENLLRFLDDSVDIVEGIHLPLGAIPQKKGITRYQMNEYVVALSLNRVYFGVWAKIYRRSLFNCSIAEIPPKIIAYEDLLLSLRIAKKARVILKTNEVVFRKRVRKESLVRAFSLDCAYFKLLDGLLSAELAGLFCGEVVLFNFRARWLRALFLLGKNVHTEDGWVSNFLETSSSARLSYYDQLVVWGIKYPLFGKILRIGARIRTFFRYKV